MNGNQSVTANFATGDDRWPTMIVTLQPPNPAAAGRATMRRDADPHIAPKITGKKSARFSLRPSGARS